MKRSKKVLISTAAVLILSAASVSMVSARGHHGGGFGGCDGGYGFWQQGPSQMTEKRGSWMKQRMQDKLDYVKYKLQITDKQEPAWQEFTTALEGKFTTMQDRMQDRGSQKTVTERVKLMREGAENMTQMADAIEKLYKSLTPEQQKLADQLNPMGRRGF